MIFRIGHGIFGAADAVGTDIPGMFRIRDKQRQSNY